MQHPLPLKFQKSAPDYRDLPEDLGAEVIFSGYSNVGKSSVINALANHKGLAKFSKTPGRTQLFNIFTLDNQRRLLDLPGYGFAKVSVKKQQEWKVQLQQYLSHRQSLQGIFVIVDVRRGLRPFDIELLEFCHQNDVAACVVLNKADKVSKSDGNQLVSQILQTYQLPKEHILLTSCSKKTGIEALRALVLSWLNAA